MLSKTLYYLLPFIFLEVAVGCPYDRCSPTEAPALWPGKCRRQSFGSPINLCGATYQDGLDLKTVKYVLNSANILYDPLNLAFVVNNSSGVVPSLETTLPTFGGQFSVVKQTWKLQKILMHIGRGNSTDEGSEHYIENKQFAGEFQFVHFNSRYPCYEDALKSGARDALLVAAVPLQLGDAKQSPAAVAGLAGGLLGSVQGILSQLLGSLKVAGNLPLDKQISLVNVALATAGTVLDGAGAASNLTAVNGSVIESCLCGTPLKDYLPTVEVATQLDQLLCPLTKPVTITIAPLKPSLNGVVVTLSPLLNAVLVPLNPLLNSLAIALDPALSGLLVALGNLVKSLVDPLPLAPLLSTLNSVLGSLLPILTPITSTVSGLLTPLLGPLLSTLLGSLVPPLGALLTPLVGTVGTILIPVTSIATPLVTQLASVTGPALAPLTGVVGSLLNTANSLVGSALSGVTGAVGLVTSVGGIAGGVVAGGTNAPAAGLGGVTGTATSVVGSLTNGLPVVGGLLGGQSSGGLLSGLLGGQSGGLPIVGNLLGGQSGGLPIVGNLLGGQSGGLPVVGNLLGGQSGGLPIVGNLLGGQSGGLPVVGSLLGGQSGGLPVVGSLLGGQSGGLPVVGSLLGGQSGGLPVVGSLLGGQSSGKPLGGLPVVSGLTAGTPINLQGLLGGLSAPTSGVSALVPTTLNLADILTKSPFYAYQGSLTSFPCDEVATWIVKKDPITVSSQVLQAIWHAHGTSAGKFGTQSLGDVHLFGNFRPLQPIAGREIFSSERFESKCEVVAEPHWDC